MFWPCQMMNPPGLGADWDPAIGSWQILSRYSRVVGLFGEQIFFALLPLPSVCRLCAKTTLFIPPRPKKLRVHSFNKLLYLSSYTPHKVLVKVYLWNGFYCRQIVAKCIAVCLKRYLLTRFANLNKKVNLLKLVTAEYLILCTDRVDYGWPLGGDASCSQSGCPGLFSMLFVLHRHVAVEPPL